ncbi:MAG: ATP phosphoribosyltransferase [Salaquimonas sp.]|nr:ATP phosphoribosyltransferase [Salaquimonas sp.]
MTIVIGRPSKGRLREKTLERFAAAGLPLSEPEDERLYRAHVEDEPEIEVRFLSAGEIARELAAGVIDLGVTGEDLVRENIPDWESRVKIEARLGFGHADVVVAIPEVWYDVRTMADLEDVAADFRTRHGRRLRIATKYWRLTQEFFSRTHAIQVYRIVESMGATEGAPASGQADVIVDITSTGSTLRANHLRVLSDGVILKSQACLVSSTRQRDSSDADLLARITSAF